jgi:hypothetical protein
MANGTKQAPLTLSQKLVVWAQGKLGKQIGKGECWDLGEQALKQAGAMTSTDLAGGSVGPYDDYVWGDSIDDVKDIQPEDIIQFRAHEVTSTTVTKYAFSAGSGSADTAAETAKRPHHTAIVNGKLDADGVVKTLEQHVKPAGQIVQIKKLYTRDVDPVVTKTMEKRTNPNTGKVEMVEVTRTVTITTKGTMWAYRPKAKP